MYLVLYSRTRVCSLICLLTQEVRHHIGKKCISVIIYIVFAYKSKEVYS